MQGKNVFHAALKVLIILKPMFPPFTWQPIGEAQNKTILEQIKYESDTVNDALLFVYIIFGILLVVLALIMKFRSCRNNDDSEYTCKE